MQDQGKAYSREGYHDNSSEKQHQTCIERVEHACKNSAYVRFMMNAMNRLGCSINPAKHIICEPCDGRLLGGFDPDRKEKCVKQRAVNSILSVRDVTRKEAESVVDSVFDACFNDTDPFERIPP
ncbi:Mitochondrial inner membrane protease ATP23-like [Exaiptasia diaphana]|nr:Mitochondrial inner membrane protease ATP23-like [Exaiptasia diaphana]